MRKIPLKFKLILALSFILLVSFVVTSVINYRLSRESIRREIMTSSLPLTSENIYSQIHSDLIRPINVASLMANDTFLRDWAIAGEQDMDKVVAYLSAIQRRYGYFAAFFVSSQTGNYYHPDGILKTISAADEHDIWFYDFVQTGKEYELDVDTNEAMNNNLTIFINYRLEDQNGDLLGVTGVGLEMDRVAKLLKKYQRTYDRSIYLVDRHGVVQAHMNPDRVQRDTISTWKNLGGPMETFLQPGVIPQQYEVDNAGQHYLLSIRYIPEFDWFLVVEQDERLALSTARSNLIRTLLVGLAASLIIIVLTVVTINHYQRRLEALASTDELTGVPNRREFTVQFARAVHRHERNATAFSLLLIDIDNLKAVNDSQGHLAGDQVIKDVCRTIEDSLRGEDMVARWGGDEFIVLLEGDERQAMQAAERIREQVVCIRSGEAQEASCDPVSISCGVSQYIEGDNLDEVTMRADQAMYGAKDSGKNAVVAG